MVVWKGLGRKRISPIDVRLYTAAVSVGCHYGLSRLATPCQFCLCACPNTFTFECAEKQPHYKSRQEEDPDKPGCTTS